MALCRGLNEITQQRAWASSWPLGGTSVCALLSCHSLSCHSPRCPTQDLIRRQEGVRCRKTLGVSGEHSWNGCLGMLQAGTSESEPGEVPWRNQDSIGGLK